jgi:GNAT superfamily N-acetyltransferase
MSTPHVLVRAEPTDIDPLSHVITEAFDLLAPSQWLVPDPVARREIFPGYFRIYLEHAMTHGTIYTTSDRDAVALWISMSPGGHESTVENDARIAAATGPWAGRFRAFGAILDKHHPGGARHDHLVILAVRPKRQHSGIGSALLSLHHRALDQEGVPAYLEAGDAGTRGLYLRHGYSDLDSPILLPDGAPMYPMWRPPSPPAAVASQVTG